MKLCILLIKIDSEPLYSFDGWYLYHVPLKEYRLQALKGTVCTHSNDNARVCFYYARNILKYRFELGEEIISMDAQYSFWYADEVLYGRFPIGENTISKDSCFSFMYARDVIKGRFELGEETIKKSNYVKSYQLMHDIKL